MSKVVVLGAGFAGQTAALYLRKELGQQHEVVMVTPGDRFTYTPSLVWVGIGKMAPEKATFELAPVYQKLDIQFKQAFAREIHPDGNALVIEYKDGHQETISYDYLINATGPLLNFEGTPGLGPEHHTSFSICSPPHAIEARDAYLATVSRMEKGEKMRILVGTGHGLATCQGAAFEYLSNIHSDLVKRGLRDRAEVMWLSNEPALGDFGVGGVKAQVGREVITGESAFKSLFSEFGIYYQVQTAITKMEQGKAYWENYEGEAGVTEFDFAMLIPQFKGIPLRYIAKDGTDITSKMANPGGFMIVDGIYGKPWSELQANDWPSTYQSPHYPNLFAAGIAFAPPGTASKPFTNKNGVPITATTPRTGMAAGTIGKVVALNIVDLVNGRQPSHREPMTQMPGACIASIGKSLWDGAAASILLYPVVPDYQTYPEYGRDLNVNRLEVGLAGAWLKRSLHTLFTYKMKGNWGWEHIPE